MEDPEVVAARARLAAKFGDSTRIGGKGSMKRKNKVAHKTNSVDEKKLMSNLKKLQVQPLPAIEEVNFFKDDNTILHFTNPQVQANIKDNFFLVQGTGESKSFADLMPGILNQLGPKNLEFLKDLVQATASKPDGEEDVPDLVGEKNFEDIANQD
ncbi:unnamed protein product [Blepharisma stoltei]|uniref:Nascent polypeptide-associated complex subunit beta n=1 Tax=Blepharisma stoltei TaxID=1481888 RepID=A0AAU9J542_9CILI|nr:unnamed protein product [Blepharisma stoltei]